MNNKLTVNQAVRQVWRYQGCDVLDTFLVSQGSRWGRLLRSKMGSAHLGE